MATSPYVLAYVRDHPLQPSPQSRRVLAHRLVLFDKIGYGPHLCHWCGEVVSWVRRDGNRRGVLVTDHLDGDKHNNDPANLVPSCHTCNAGRARNRVRDDELWTTTTGRAGRQRAVPRTCRTCGQGFPLARQNASDPSKGRYCCIDCRYGRGHTQTCRAGI